MGFFLGQSERAGYKQHLNLTDVAWSIIEQDRNTFFCHRHPSLSGFLNLVFLHFFLRANATITPQLDRVHRQMDYVFDLPLIKKRIDRATTDTLYKEILKIRSLEIVEDVQRFPKGVGKKIRLNKMSCHVLETLATAQYYDNHLGRYLKCLFEEYTRLSSSERERIVFSGHVRIFNLALANHQRLQITLGTGAKIQFVPYAIKSDPIHMFNFMVGLIQDGNEAFIRPIGIRFSCIIRIRKIAGGRRRIPATLYGALEKVTPQTPPQMAAMKEAMVVFDEEGVALFESHSEGRPLVGAYISPLYLRVLGDETALKQYFLPFGNHARLFLDETPVPK